MANTNILVSINLDKAKAEILSAMPAFSDRQRILSGLGAAALSIWKSLAQNELKSSSRDYVAGLNMTIIGGDEARSVEISLTGRIPNMVEQGWDGGDMRQWLLKGKNAKQGEHGAYNTVPFRHGTPGTSGRNVGQTMPQAIHDVAKNLLPSISRPGKAVSQEGGQTSVFGTRLHRGLPMSQEALAILNTKKRPWHSTSIYMGMVRKAKQTQKGMQTTGFITFRRISEHSADPQHWVHPGIKARKLAEKTQAQVDKLSSAIIDAAMKPGGKQ
jgi:hypothetical protein